MRSQNSRIRIVKSRIRTRRKSRRRKQQKIRSSVSSSGSISFDNLTIRFYIFISIAVVYKKLFMLPSKIVESHIVEAKNSTPVKQHYIELSPKGKSKRTLQRSDEGRKIEIQNSRSFAESQGAQKENNPINFQVVNMPIRAQKPFQKIPTFRTQQVIIRNKTRSLLESERNSKKKKITVTKLINENLSSGSKQPSPFEQEQNVANEQF